MSYLIISYHIMPYLIIYIISYYIVIEHVNKLYLSCTYNHFPENEPRVSKHEENILKLKYWLKELYFVGIYYMIILQCTV